MGLILSVMKIAMYEVRNCPPMIQEEPPGYQGIIIITINPPLVQVLF